MPDVERLPADVSRAAREWDKAGEGAQKRRLPSAVRSADQRESRPKLDGHIAKDRTIVENDRCVAERCASLHLPHDGTDRGALPWGPCRSSSARFHLHDLYARASRDRSGVTRTPALPFTWMCELSRTEPVRAAEWPATRPHRNRRRDARSGHQRRGIHPAVDPRPRRVSGTWVPGLDASGTRPRPLAYRPGRSGRIPSLAEVTRA